MRHDIYKTSQAIVAIGTCASIAFSCGSSARSGDDKSGTVVKRISVDPRRTARQRTITRLLAPAHNANDFICLRLPTVGPDVILVVPDLKEVPQAKGLLRRYRIAGTVEVKTPDAYGLGIQRLGEQIEREVPKTPLFRMVNVAYGHFYGALRCPRILIQLGVPGQVAPQVIAWARKVKAHYGADRVQYNYYPLAHTA